MPKKSLADKLREKANRAASRNAEKGRVIADAKRAAATKQARKLVKKIIADLPKKLAKAARDGQTSLMVLESGGYSHELYQAIRSLLCGYANENGIHWENGNVRYSDDSPNYDCLYFRWDKK